ncbi:MAG: hypothetical protein C4521_01260 [Actinobacteria bacterium]|jgi:hypothetical protein|nr:MAG: hypothetical protein C4521_01260 [Actinomycetota bacterium]
MDVVTAIETAVKPKLEDSFGKETAMLIIMRAAASSEIPMVGLRPQHFRSLCEAICADERVRGTWGEAGSVAQLEEWNGLVERRTS